MADLTDYVNARRERDTRTLPIEAAQVAATTGARQAQTAAAPDNTEGFWDDATGGYKLYFKFGISKFGDGSVFK